MTPNYYLMKQYLKPFGPIMHSFLVIAWSLTLHFDFFGLFIFILAIYLTLKMIFSRCGHVYTDFTNNHLKQVKGL